MPITGTCLCEQIRLTVDLDQLPETSACFCSNCKKAGSTPMSVVMRTPREKVTIDGKPNVYPDITTTSGVIMDRLFCGNCGSPVLSRTPLDPNHYYLKAAFFDHPIPQPTKIDFEHRKEPWVHYDIGTSASVAHL
ncbi:hypothetical protein SISNIDRAFT_282477 [Sistotremastrum niveocremeum HHB9708]|uniref:CENP-V/GFA domain-containing protein n=1 Tax=Sistotremastrum niveocremeum HHB9708 TaxID=1314777 RepID=A0A164Y841_9AGAM|nr:hypothetical protein SISNIDRAFT_282477 [Sistotremastrum niveocremeum HHB9708]